ncbi:MAG: hypothetical protein A7316_11180 [Candidatus Altiarchaeales archaeon WOR_SM1_86-2]|nr:MAG: hypothetical protein A7316_11180 [Candidatus Altiarchaeales archaeon WOR_SM1_86-2]
MKVKSLSHSTGKIVSLLDRGSSFAVDLDAVAEAELLGGGEDIVCSKELYAPAVKNIAKKIMGFFGCDYGVELKIEHDIPEGVGLGDMEAVSTAAMLSVVGALARHHGSINELKIDKYLKEQFVVIDDKVVDKRKLIEICSGNDFDRMCAAACGGFIVADNKNKEILRRGEMETLHAVIVIPDADKVGFNPLLSNESEIAWQEALKGNLYSAMKLNNLVGGRKIHKEIMEKMLESGALTASVSGGGPGMIGLVRDENKIEGIVHAVEGHGEVFVKKTANEGARILEKPRKIIKVSEFLELDGAGEFRYL